MANVTVTTQFLGETFVATLDKATCQVTYRWRENDSAVRGTGRWDATTKKIEDSTAVIPVCVYRDLCKRLQNWTQNVLIPSPLISSPSCRRA